MYMYNEIIKNYFREFVLKSPDLYLSQMSMGRFDLTVLYNHDTLEYLPNNEKLINDIIEILQVILESFKGTYYLAFKGSNDCYEFRKIHGRKVTRITEVNYHAFFNISLDKNIFYED